MKRLGLFLLAKEANAIIVAFLSALLPIFYIPTGFIAVIIIGLVTLQKGAKSGLWILLWVALPTIALLIVRHVGPFDLLLLRCIVIWVLATILHRYHAWSLLLELIALIGVIFIFGLHFWIPNLQQWWTTELTAYLQPLISNAHWKMTMTPSEFAGHLALIATGATAFFFMSSVLLELMVARYWQSCLLNVGGFAKEFVQIRVARIAAILIGVLFVLIFFKIKAAVDAFPLALLPFFIAGLSLLHFLVRQKKQLIYLMIAIYVALIFLPALAVSALAMMAFVDTWFDFRKKYNTK